MQKKKLKENNLYSGKLKFKLFLASSFNKIHKPHRVL